MKNDKEIRRYMNVIKRALTLMETLMDDDGGDLEQLSEAVQPRTVHQPVGLPSLQPQPVQQLMQPQPVGLPSLQPEAQQPQPIQSQPIQPQPVLDDPEYKAARQKHIQDLMDIDCWPEAVPPFLLANEVSKEDQINRANSVLDMMIDRNMEGKSFLDFGCGEGWITQEAAKRGVSEILGYDIKIDSDWGKREGVSFTNDFDTLPQQHYDFVMLYDVLDHCEDPVDVMAKVKTVLKPDGVVFVRCHPWTAKHATHLYKQGVNKAYWHMFLSWDEIKEQIEGDPVFTRSEKDPVKAYRWWFDDFNIEKERLIQEDVSEFFLVPDRKELLSDAQQISMEEIDGYLDRMRIQFADYVLGSPK